ncbi:MAG TPA: PAS domain-containing sensor histidine kinase [Micromonosporaceae bacterium]
MRERPDYPALLAGVTELIDRINSGEAGLHILDKLLRAGQRSLGAAGMSFVEHGHAGGRVIAATGAAEWTLGRPVTFSPAQLARLLTGPPTRDIRHDALTGAVADLLRGCELSGMALARAEIGNTMVGTIHAHYAEAGPAPAEHHAVLAYLARSVAHMYGHQAGLPVHGDGPVIAALTDGLAIVDRDGTVRLWNPAAERLTGRPPVEMLGRRLPLPIPPPGQLVEHQLPDGRRLEITAGELPGTVASRVVSFREASDRRDRDHDRDLFVAITSHELRTPVTVIKGYAETLSEHWTSLDESERQQAAVVIGQRASELARLVERLLSAADHAGSMGTAPPAAFDFVAALRAAVRELPARLRGRLTVRLPEDLPKAHGDQTGLTTVLTELATNADRYSPADTPVELTAGADELTVFFRVSDRGLGVHPEHVERAFDRFWQAESGDRRRFPGAGLGLYLVRRVVERQKGWVSLRPRDGGGTVAEVRLPRA